jgi:fructokinase
MTDDVSREATMQAVQIAKESGKLISFDPNYREPLWKSVDQAMDAMEYGFDNCDILKISDNEVELFTGFSDIEAGARKIKRDFGVSIVFATLGPKGIMAIYKDMVVYKEGYLNPDTIETTGAGDTFCACAIDYIHRKGIDNLSKNDLIECLDFANAAASIITTKKGALAVMPTKKDVETFLSDH